MSRVRFVVFLALGALFMLGCEGTEGPPGAAGADGTNGTNGTDGSDGAAGADGASGLDGADGDAGDDGIDGVDGADGVDGVDGVDGEDGEDGENGEDGLGVEIENFHGEQTLLDAAFDDAGKFFADMEITAATADEFGLVTVDYMISDDAGDPVVGVTGADFNIVALQPAAGDNAWNTWVAYNYRDQTVSGDDFPNPDGTAMDQAYRENGGVHTDNGDGTYSYVFDTDISAVVTPVAGTAIAYDRTLTHRVSVMIGGHSGATADAVFDFVPDGSAITETRDIVQTDVCLDCHGNDFHGHGGDRLTLENCNTCHLTGSLDPHSGETVDMKVMIHKIHAGGEVASIAGVDGVVWDDPDTADDESADNGDYTIYGYQNNGHSWWKVAFPANIQTCTKCHTGGGLDVDNWMNVPSREVCGSCHDLIDWGTGDGHDGGAQANDSSCAACHPATGASSVGGSVVAAHDWQSKIPRNIPEFDVDLTVSAPANGTHFVAGEQPVVSVALTDVDTGLLLDHQTITKSASADKEGCLEDDDPCPPRDGAFSHVYAFVTGPRAERVPVLTPAARVELVSDGAGPFDLSAGGSLSVTFDGGRTVWTDNVTALAGSASLTIDLDPVASDDPPATFTDASSVSAAEVVDWLNADDGFYGRAMAMLNDDGEVVIRNRNLGTYYSLQFGAGDVTDAVFGGNTDAKGMAAGYYASNDLAQHDDPADDLAGVVWNTDNIEFTLDAVDDLQPGTYVASVEIADAGRIDGDNYRTPSVAKVTFQVGQADEELPIARNCDSCHQDEDGTGYILDYARHYKIFDDTAIDQCAACHDSRTRYPTDTVWNGGKEIGRRVHGIHNGSALNYPLATVEYSGGDPVHGRNWDITLPQDVRNCESCHGEGTSGTWTSNPGRQVCRGCHDSDDAQAHYLLMTWDPTPTTPFNGDEVESCAVCH